VANLVIRLVSPTSLAVRPWRGARVKISFPVRKCGLTDNQLWGTVKCLIAVASSNGWQRSASRLPARSRLAAVPTDSGSSPIGAQGGFKVSETAAPQFTLAFGPNTPVASGIQCDLAAVPLTPINRSLFSHLDHSEAVIHQ